MKDKYNIDSHKLMYHPHIISNWMDGKNTPPILINVCPIGKCNHRCIFCGYNYTGYKGPTLKTKEFKIALESISNIGTKAINYNNEGEPLLHPDMADIINYTAKVGMESSIETNGVLLDRKFQKSCVHSISYIKFSVDAGTPETHYKLHRGGKDDFKKVIQNIKDVSKIKGDCTIGIQMLLLKENENEVKILLNLLDGVDYDWFGIKPFSRNPFQDYSLVNPGDINKVKDVPGLIVREYGFERENILSNKRDYKTCYGINFFTNIDCTGDVTICNALIKKNKYILGNIYKESFEDIWKNRKYKEYPVKDCKRYQCRMDKQNVYLWNLKHPIKDVNFI